MKKVRPIKVYLKSPLEVQKALAYGMNIRFGTSKAKKVKNKATAGSGITGYYFIKGNPYDIVNNRLFREKTEYFITGALNNKKHFFEPKLDFRFYRNLKPTEAVPNKLEFYYLFSDRLKHDPYLTNRTLKQYNTRFNYNKYNGKIDRLFNVVVPPRLAESSFYHKRQVENRIRNKFDDVIHSDREKFLKEIMVKDLRSLLDTPAQRLRKKIVFDNVYNYVSRRKRLMDKKLITFLPKNYGDLK